MNKERVIEKYALDNAIKFAGQAKVGNIIGKVIRDYPKWKDGMEEIKKLAQEIVAKVNKLSVFEQTERLKHIAPELLKPKEKVKKEPLKNLQNVIKGKVVMRFEPSPSGALHIGHAYPLLLNHAYCKKYNGKLLLRIADTNPDSIVPEAYELIEQDARWITQNKIAEVIYQSDRMETYYTHALTLLEQGHAYVCTCSQEDFKQSITKKLACPCREGEQVKKWKQMFTTFKEGDAVVRLKTDLNHKNPALRDFPILRINENEHPRQGMKYRVWPLMNFAVAMDDHELGLTHVLRGKDHVDNTKRQLYIYDYFNWQPPEFIHTGRINFEGLNLSASQTALAIKQQEFSAWDDIRLPFLAALKRRGYQPEAFEKFMLSMGLTLVDKRVPATEFFKTLNYYNKEIIDPIAKRFFFIPDPVEIEIKNAKEKQVELDLHPENQKGGRKLNTKTKFYLAKQDLDNIKDKELVRLMNLMNITKQKNEFSFHSESYTDWKGKSKTIIHWLPVEEDVVDIVLHMDDGSQIIGKGEFGIRDLKEGEIVQFERVAFAKLDKIKNNTYHFWFTHK